MLMSAKAHWIINHNAPDLLGSRRGDGTCGQALGTSFWLGKPVRADARRAIWRLATSRMVPCNPGDHPPVLTAAVDQAHSLVGWQRRHTDLAETLRYAWSWLRQHRPVGCAKRRVPTPR